jgi:hypothetical protein
MAFADKGKFDTPAYIECFKYFYHLDESALDSTALVLSRKYPNPLTGSFGLFTSVTEVVLASLNLWTEKASKRSKIDVFLTAGVVTTGDVIWLKMLDLGFD